MYGHKWHKYSAEEKEFMRQYVLGHSYREIQQAFTERFGWPITVDQVKSYIGNNKLNTGHTGRYKKGSVPTNKGKKGIVFLGSEKGWFKKGHTPKNYRPVGSERISKDGYIEIKTKDPNKWEFKNRVVWKSINGAIPEGHMVIFRDGDKTNTAISNLMLIKRSTNAVLNHTNLHEYNGDLKETAVRIAELKVETGSAKRRALN